MVWLLMMLLLAEMSIISWLHMNRIVHMRPRLHVMRCTVNPHLHIWRRVYVMLVPTVRCYIAVVQVWLSLGNVKSVMHWLTILDVLPFRPATLIMMDIVVVVMNWLVRLMHMVLPLVIVVVRRVHSFEHIVRRFFD